MRPLFSKSSMDPWQADQNRQYPLTLPDKLQDEPGGQGQVYMQICCLKIHLSQPLCGKVAPTFIIACASLRPAREASAAMPTTSSQPAIIFAHLDDC